MASAVLERTLAENQTCGLSPSLMPVVSAAVTSVALVGWAALVAHGS